MQRRPEWQTAAEMLMRAAEGGGLLMFAYIGMLRATRFKDFWRD